MKVLSVAPISSTAFMPIKSGTLQFLQDSYNDQIFALLSSSGIYWSQNQPYILSGVQFTVSPGGAGAFSYTGGYVYYAGEIFQVVASSGTQISGHVIVSNIDTTQYLTDADPVTFSDTSTHNVHNIRTISFSDSSSAGAGQSLYTDFIPINPNSVSNVLVSSFPAGTYGFNMIQSSTVKLPSSLSGNYTFAIGDSRDVPGTKLKFIIGLSGTMSLTFAYNIATSFSLNKNSGLQASVLSLPSRSSAYVIELEYLGTFSGNRYYSYSWA